MISNSNNIQAACNIVESMTGKNVKVIKKESGLLERENNQKIIITEDSRQVLFG